MVVDCFNKMLLDSMGCGAGVAQHDDACTNGVGCWQRSSAGRACRVIPPAPGIHSDPLSHLAELGVRSLLNTMIQLCIGKKTAMRACLTPAACKCVAV